MSVPTLPNNATPLQRAAYDALMIQEGACNPSGIARALVTVIDAVRASDLNVRQHPAVRLVLHQLTYIVYGADIAIGTNSAYPTWDADMEACRKLLADAALEQARLMATRLLIELGSPAGESDAAAVESH